MPAETNTRHDDGTEEAFVGGLSKQGCPVPDLDSRAAIHDLVVQFYREVVFDDLLEPIFGEVAEVDWAMHMPKLVDYWCRVLLGQPGYGGHVLASHRHLHDLQPLTLDLFDRWLTLWVDAVDSGWAGPNANKAKSHARRIGMVLARRIMGVEWNPQTMIGPVG
jgi:hemoglobin